MILKRKKQNIKEIKEEFIWWKFLVDIGMFMFAFIALLVSFRSCNISDRAYKVSEDAKKLAEDSLETSKCQFIQINRPYIVLSPSKFSDGLFWKVVQNKNHVEVNVKYKIKNVGNVAAKSIKLPSEIIIGPKIRLKKGAPVYYKKMDEVTLGPGESFNIEPTIVMEFENEEVAKINYEHLISDKSEGVIFHIPISYVNELDESQKYRTQVENKIHNDKALIMKSEMLNLKDD